MPPPAVFLSLHGKKLFLPDTTPIVRFLLVCPMPSTTPRGFLRPNHKKKVVVLRHSLYALRGEDVMAAEFEQVAWVTFAILALAVGAMVGLNTVGVAQVRGGTTAHGTRGPT